MHTVMKVLISMDSSEKKNDLTFLCAEHCHRDKDNTQNIIGPVGIT